MLPPAAVAGCLERVHPKALDVIPVNFLGLLGIRYDIKHAEPGSPALSGATLANRLSQFRSCDS